MAIVCPLLAVTGFSMFLGALFPFDLPFSISEATVTRSRIPGSKKKNTDYGALFLEIIGVYSSAPCLSTWLANNVQPHYRRATAVAIAFVATNIGGIVSPWFFTDPPRFHKATSINLAVSLGMAASSAGIIFYLRACNAKKRKQVENYLQTQGQGLGRGEWDSPEERKRLGDRHPRFEFTL
jgi:hypothetical protein